MNPLNARPWATRNTSTWLVWEVGGGRDEEDAREVLARDAEEAAEDYAEESDSDSADYTVLKGSPLTVCVRAAHDGAPVERFVVTGEAVPEYTARAVAELEGT